MAGEYIEFNNNTQPALNDTNVNRLQQLIKQDIQSAVSGDTLPVGAILPFGSDTIPDNWLLCNGQEVSRTDYYQLFNVIGTTYGAGDGFTTFKLPDLQGRIPVGLDENDEDFDTLAETGGEKEHTLTIEEMPSHTHTGTPRYYRATSVEQATENNSQTGSQGTTSATGGGQAHNILQPYIVTNYIIKAQQSSGVVATVVDGLNSISATNALSANQGRILNDRFNYSTTEEVVGTWIDGKPIYRKVVTETVSNINESIDINLGTADVETFIDGKVIFDTSNFTSIINSQGATSYYIRNFVFRKISSNNTVTVATNINGISGTVYVIIEYTKTTD